MSDNYKAYNKGERSVSNLTSKTNRIRLVQGIQIITVVFKANVW